MKVHPELHANRMETSAANLLTLPHGLIGFANYKRAELLYSPENPPFIWMKLLSAVDDLHFVVIEPGAHFPGYEPEIFDSDAELLDLRDPAEAMLLNIVTLRHGNPAEATVNLIGPLVVNRRTRSGRQLVISNYARYSANHSLIESSPAPVEQVTSHI